MKRLKPILHARDHMPGGADPIPGMLPHYDTYRNMVQAIPGLWAYWPLDDDSGLVFEEVVAGRDMTGEQHSPYLFEYDIFGPIVGDAGTGIAFTGKDSAVAIDLGTKAYYTFTTGDNLNALLGGLNTFTVVLWFLPYTPVVPNQAGVVNQDGYLWSVGDAGSLHMGLYLEPDGDLVVAREGATDTSTVRPFVDSWNHAAVTCDGTDLNLYLNGALTGGLTPASMTLSTHRFQLGVNPQSGGYVGWFEGAMAHAAIFDVALDDEILGVLAAADGPEGTVPVAPGDGGPVVWKPPVAVTVNGAPGPPAAATLNLVEGAGVSVTVDGPPPAGMWDITLAATSTSDPATDTLVWMPLVDSDGFVVLDSTGVIPTLIPLV